MGTLSRVGLQCLLELEDLTPSPSSPHCTLGYSIEKGLSYDDIHLQKSLI